ncbi:response regulator [Desulforhopalus singaporensis]|uniref:Response regulator receiver domain-containing protein n=1 Tax=Desulforhopalus singaporensis TaxID=91360 RepID=A0A1H0KHB4_9BACT|nr:response regulator [Desulforhopalus singaporensis]SDO55151.1 Response regulator receiver domain-containing protein [Desulforhopalus singaporensis]
MTRYSVLVVDDEQDFREIMVKKLRKKELECDGAPDGETALQMFSPGKYDVVLLDVKMPGRDGIEILQEMKKIAPMTEVVMLTGHASVESGINGIKFGAFDYLMKPMDMERLMEKLDAAYERKRSQQQKIEMAQIKKDMAMPS